MVASEWYTFGEKGATKVDNNFNIGRYNFGQKTYRKMGDPGDLGPTGPTGTQGTQGNQGDKRKKDSVKIQGWWFMTLVNSIEVATFNSSFIYCHDVYFTQ